MESIKLTDKIPTGAWTIYFHQADMDKWSLDTFVKVQTCITWQDVLSVIEEIGTARFKNGLPFFMRGETLPLWENYQNIRGGSYSIKVPYENVKEVFTTQLLHAMTDSALKDKENVCMGLSMSPKKGTFNILKIWNANAEKFNNPNELNFLDQRCLDSEILYTPHVQKRM